MAYDQALADAEHRIAELETERDALRHELERVRRAGRRLAAALADAWWVEAAHALWVVRGDRMPALREEGIPSRLVDSEPEAEEDLRHALTLARNSALGNARSPFLSPEVRERARDAATRLGRMLEAER